MSADGPAPDGPPPAGDGRSEAAPPPVGSEPAGWLRLDARMIWADALRVLLSLTPAGIALLIVRVEPAPGVLWPVAAVAAWGVVNSAADVLRWITTRYRVTEEYVERRTGLFVRTHRSMRRERIRSVDADARLLQRLVGLRRVKVGAGQMNTAMESALVLDAVSKAAAAELRRRLLGGGAGEGPAPRPAGGDAPAADVPADAGRPGDAPAADAPPRDAATGGTPPAAEGVAAGDARSGTRVFAGLRWWWVCYHMVSFWAFVSAAGLLWGAYFGLTMFGLDPSGWLGSLADWEAVGTAGTVAVAVAATAVLGALGLGWNFFTEYAHFRLARVPGEHGTLLRTTQGLFKTREVNRDDNRLRGLAVSEPLLWRWMRMADTTVITTGLSVWSMSSTILPRGPRSVALRVAAAVLDAPENPLTAPLRRHPRAALRRRVVWALAVTGAGTGVLAWLTATTALPARLWQLTGAGLAVLALGLAWAGHRALGHAFAGRDDAAWAPGGPYVVVRSGAVSRTTSALQRRAVSGVRVRQSLFQRRLGLATVSLSTAAGWGGYSAVDMPAAEAVDFAARALPGGLVDAFRADRPAAAGARTDPAERPAAGSGPGGSAGEDVSPGASG